jgi:hypothetical protein
MRRLHRDSILVPRNSALEVDRDSCPPDHAVVIESVDAKARDLTSDPDRSVRSAKERIHRAIALSLGFDVIATAPRDSHRSAAPTVGGCHNLESL